MFYDVLISWLCLLLLQSSKNDFRRKWDKDEYENLAEKRLAEERDKERRDGERTSGLTFVGVIRS